MGGNGISSWEAKGRREKIVFAGFIIFIKYYVLLNLLSYLPASFFIIIL